MTIEKLNEAFDSTKENFEGSFHTTLWRVCVDNVTNGKIACFVSNYTENGLQLGIAYANESGYSPCPAYFKNTNRDEANKVLAELNRIVFDIDEETSLKIMLSSMRGKPNVPA